MELIRIDQESCHQDGLCAEVCPARIIDFQPGSYPGLAPGAEHACIQCGHCVAVCPYGSLDHRAMSAAQCPPVQRELQLSAEHCEHFLRSRRSIRAYKDKAVDASTVQRLIRMSRYAPTGRNAQDAEWLLLGRKEEIHGIADLVVDWMRRVIQRDPELAALMQLEHTVKRWQAGVDIIFRHAPMVIVAHAEKDNPRAQTSCTIALTHLELAATSLGLGCCWAGYFMRAATEYVPLMAALGLSQGHQSFGAVMVGHPRFRYHRLPLRNPPRITWRI